MSSWCLNGLLAVGKALHCAIFGRCVAIDFDLGTRKKTSATTNSAPEKHTVYQPRGRYLIYSASNTCIIYYTLIIYHNVSSAIQICTVALHPREIWIHLCSCTPSDKVWLKIMTSRLALSTHVHVWMKYDLGQPACKCMYQKVPHQLHRFDEIKLAGSQISSLIKARTSSTFRALGGPVWERESVLKIK